MTRSAIRRRPLRTLVATSASAVLVVGLAGCSGAERDPNTVTIAYQKFGSFIAADTLFKKVKKEFEAENPDATVELRAIEAPAEDYQTQVNLMNRSGSEAPDLIYEDSFTINQDVDAGYLQPLDEYWDKWEDAEHFNEQADKAVTGLDGKRYGAMLGTDTRGLWYNKKLLEKAGIKTPWAPKDWDELLETARTIKSELGKDVVPLHVPSGQPLGEEASMQGFQMLHTGTAEDGEGGALFDEEQQKWITGDPGFVDSLEFVETVYGEGLGLDEQDALNANVSTINNEQRIPEGELAISMNGSWVPQAWIESANKPWPEWQETMEFVPMPTQNGQEPGATSLSGGWTLAMGSKAANPDLAWKVMAHTLNQENATKFAIEGAQVPVRDDVAEDEEFKKAPAVNDVANELVDVTHFRPAYSEYPKVSIAITKAMEAVMLGDASPAEAAKAYDEEVAKIAGDDKVTKADG